MNLGQTVLQKDLNRQRISRSVAAAALLSLTLFFPPLSAGFAKSATNVELLPGASPETAKPAMNVVAEADPAVVLAAADQPSPGVMDSVQDWLARANRAFQGTVVRRLSTPSSGDSDDAIAQKLKDVKDQERAAKEAEDAKRQAEAAAKRKEAEDAAAAKAAADAQAKAEAEARAKEQAEANAQAEDAKRNADDAIRTAQKLAEERQAAEEKKKAEEDAKRQAEEQQAREAARKAEEERLAAEAEKNRQRTITVTPEPLPSAAPPATSKVASADDVASSAGRYERHLWRGPAVKRWIWRSRGQCHYAGRIHRGRYTVRRGDTLWLIAKRYYRAGWRYRRILHANRWLIRHPGLIYPCQRLYLPRPHPHR